MLEFKAHAFVAALNSLDELDRVAASSAEWVYQDQGRVDHMQKQLATILGAAQTLGLKQSVRKANYMKVLLGGALGKPAPSLAVAFKDSLAELRDRLAGELEDRAIYSIEDHKFWLLNMGLEPFGPEVAERFKNTSEDISEAAHCLAMSRNTAAVFHLMRVMEIAVKALGETLKCTVIDKNDKDLEWGKILGNIGSKVEELPKGPKKDEWSSVVTMLYHVKQAWRNTTMHPKQTYTDDEALAAFNAVKSFMTELAALEAP